MASFKKYRVGSKFKLVASRLRPTRPSSKAHEDDAARSSSTRWPIELDELQNLLHAEGRRKLLLVLQGMDTSGKDGTIRWVFSRTSPLGVRVTAFKAPSDEERAHDFLWRCHAVVPRTRRDHGVEPQPLRRRAGAGGRGLDRQGRDRGAAMRRSTTSSAC